MLKKVGLLLTVLAVCLATKGFAQNNKIDPSFLKYQKMGGPLPELKIETNHSKTITNKDLKVKHHLLLIIFNPTCSHCIKMSKLICSHANLFKNTKVVFMAQQGMMSYFPDYEKKTGFDQHPEFILGVDKNFTIDKLANYKLLPMINIYNKEHQLVKTFNGDIPLDSLKQYLP